MNRYISKYIKLDDAIDYECPFNEIWEDCIDCPLNDSAIEPCKMGKWLKSLPTIDIVECDECLHKVECMKVVKRIDGALTWLNWCSFGERIEE